MTLYCNLCNMPFKEADEVMFVGFAYWHELKSAVSYSISRPHEVDQDSFQHVSCGNYYGKDKQP